MTPDPRVMDELVVKIMRMGFPSDGQYTEGQLRYVIEHALTQAQAAVWEQVIQYVDGVKSTDIHAATAIQFIARHLRRQQAQQAMEEGG